MNFFNNFSEQWSSRFPDSSQPPQLECLKADHFCTLLDQKQAIEVEESKICAVLEELKSQLARESFIADFLHKCIQKLGAVSQVFSEIDQCDSKSSSSSSTTGRHPGSIHSPGLPLNGSGMVANSKSTVQTSGSPFPLFPQCITSSLIHSASPLLAAAAATSTAPFLLPSSLSHFPCPDSIKLDPESEPLHAASSSFLLPGADRQSYGNLSRLTSPSSLYNNNTGVHHNSGSSTNLFNASTNHFNHSIHSSPFNGAARDGDPCRLSDENPNSEAQVAAAAVAAAFGLGLSSVRSVGASQSLQQTGHAVNFGRPNSLLSPSLSMPALHAAGNNAESQITAVSHSSATSATSTNLDGCAGGQALDTVNTTERPYRCSTCSRSFAVKAGLVQHMRTHTDERPYPCLHCGRAFKQKIQLTTHMRVHSGERPYGCRLCGKLFRQQSHVVQHLRTHTGEKPHKCYQCGKAFRQKYSLISHQRRMCRNRAASNPIAAGMTMWISPGAGGDTCNLVKEFSPTKCHLRTTASSNSSPSSATAISVTATVSMPSPFSPFLSSPSVSTTTAASTTTLTSGPSTTAQFHSPPANQAQSSHPDDDRHLNSLHGPAPNAIGGYRHHRSDTIVSGSDSHLTQLCSDRESEKAEEPICSPHTTHMNTPTALGLS